MPELFSSVCPTVVQKFWVEYSEFSRWNSSSERLLMTQSKKEKETKQSCARNCCLLSFSFGCLKWKPIWRQSVATKPLKMMLLFLGYVASISAAQGLSNPSLSLQSSSLESGCLAPLTFCWRSAGCLLLTAAFLSDGDPTDFTEVLALFTSSAWRECWHGVLPFMGWHRTPAA